MKGPKGRHAWMVKVGERGQLVIPKEARDIFGIKPGDTLLLLADEKKGIAIPPANACEKLISAIFKNSTEEVMSDDEPDDND